MNAKRIAQPIAGFAFMRALQVRSLVLVFMALALVVNAATELHSFTNLNHRIPDGTRAGFMDVRKLASSIRKLSAVRIKLQVAGEFNGDLYAYVRQVNTQATNFCVLLNRSGKSALSPAGYGDAGFRITLDSAASNDVHFYRAITNVPEGLALSGVWQPDGRNSDPLAVLDTSPRTTRLDAFGGVDAGGEWTLFVADTDAGAMHVLLGWEIELVGATEPPLAWSTPGPIVYGTPLGPSQLNATSGGVAGVFVYTPPAGTVLSASSNQLLSVTFVPADPADYVAATATVPLTVLKAPLTVAGMNTNRAYGSANPVFAGTITGTQNGDSITATYSCGATAGSPIGSYNIVPSPSGATLTNYTVTLVNGILTVNRAALTVSANSASRIYGDANPLFTGAITGIKNGETISASYGCSATPGSPIGSYNIVPSPSGATLTNYTVTLVNGTLTISAAPLTVTATSTNRVYGTGNPLFTGTVSGTKNSDLVTATYACSATVSSPAGLYDIVPAASGPAVSNYSVTAVNGTLTITKAGCSGVVMSSVNPQVPGQPVTFSVTLSPDTPSVGTPAGSVQFKVDGAPAGSPVPLVGGVASYTNAGLGLGVHTVVTEYGGGLNFLGTTNSLSPAQLINTPPVAGPDVIERYPTNAVAVKIATLLSNDSDADADLITFLGTSATSAAGATISREGNSIVYQPPAGFTNADSFTYTIGDGSARATGSVTVRVIEYTSAPRLTILPLSSSALRLRLNGSPNRSCVLEYTSTLSGSSWMTLTNGTTDAGGVFECLDTLTPASPSRFYRALHP